MMKNRLIEDENATWAGTVKLGCNSVSALQAGAHGQVRLVMFG
jgi:hypothetical protein